MAGLAAQPQGAAHVRPLAALLDAATRIEPFGDQGDDRVRGVGGHLRAVGRPQAPAATWRGVLYQGGVHPQANPQIGDALLPGVAGRRDLALEAALAEPPRHQDGIRMGQHGRAFGLDLLRVDMDDIDPRCGLHARVPQGLVDGHVGVGQVRVLADHATVTVLSACFSPRSTWSHSARSGSGHFSPKRSTTMSSRPNPFSMAGMS